MNSLKNRISRLINRSNKPAALLVLFSALYIITSYLGVFNPQSSVSAHFCLWEINEITAALSTMFFAVFASMVNNPPNVPAENEIEENIKSLNKRYKYESILSTVTRSVHKSINLEDVFENSVQSLHDNMEIARHVSIYLIEGEFAVLKASRGLPKQLTKRLEKIPSPKGFTWKVLIDAKPRNCPDVDKDEVIGPAGKKAGIMSYLSVPIIEHSKSIGCINVHSFEKNAFGSDELNLINIIARQIEMAAGNAKQAEALKESENRYRTLVEHSYDLILEVSMEGRFLFLSKNHKKHLGYEPEELIGKSIFDNMHPEDKPHVLRSFMEAQKTFSSSVEVLYRYRHKDGSWRWFNSTGRPFKTASGELRGVISSRDITDRKHEEEKRLEIEEKYRNFVEYSHDLITEVDSNSIILFANNSLKTQLGYEPEELVGRSIFQKIHPEDKKSIFRKILLESSKAYNTGTHVLRYKHKNGGFRWLESRFTSYKTSSGESHTVIYSTDITERKKMEEEIQKSEKLESLSMLAGGIAHDFNNLLTIILGNVGLARINKSSGKDISRMLAEAEDAIKSATGLTQQLLTFSKASEPNVRVMIINQFLKDTTEFALRGSNVECCFKLAKDLKPVEIDDGQINQVINNLIINAQQAMPGGGSIQVGAKNTILEKLNPFNIPGGEYVQISIKDNGRGMPKETLDKIFDPFFSTKEHGSGLGLASSFSIIKQHKGHIAVDSEVSLGTTFNIYLPAINKSPAAPGNKQSTLLRGQGNILIMDDQPKIREVLSEMARFLGYKTKLAKDSSEAIQIYKESLESGDKLDAVILDLTIPGDIGGLETLKKLFELDKDIKAIVSSGYSDRKGTSNYKELGFKASIPKPYNLNKVSEVLYRVIMSTENSDQ